MLLQALKKVDEVDRQTFADEGDAHQPEHARLLVEVLFSIKTVLVVKEAQTRLL